VLGDARAAFSTAALARSTEGVTVKTDVEKRVTRRRFLAVAGAGGGALPLPGLRSAASGGRRRRATENNPFATVESRLVFELP